MSSPHDHATGHHLVQTAERAAGRTLAVALGVVMMVSGLGMGVTMVMLPIGLPLGLTGLLLVLWGVFYSTPAAGHGHGSDHGHGHGSGHGHGPAAH